MAAITWFRDYQAVPAISVWTIWLVTNFILVLYHHHHTIFTVKYFTSLAPISDIFLGQKIKMSNSMLLLCLDKAPTASVSHIPSFPSGGLSPPMPSQSQSSSSAMHAAILAGNGLSLFHLLSSQKVDLNESIDSGIWLLHCAVECGSEGTSLPYNRVIRFYN